MVTKENLHEKALYLLLLSLPIWPQLTILLTVGIFLFLLLKGRLKDRFSIKKMFSFHQLYLFILLLIGLFWTQNIKIGTKECSEELYILIFPLIFSFKEFSSGKTITAIIKKGLVNGSILASLVCLGYAIIQYFKTRDIDCFTYTSLSIFLHPSYFGFILLTSLALLIEGRFQGERDKSMVKILFLVTTIILLLSKVVLLCLLIMLLYFGFVYILTKKTNFKFILRSVIMAIAIGFSALLFLKKFNRFSQIDNAFKDRNNLTLEIAPIDSLTYNSSTIRIAHWKYCYSIRKTLPVYGAGTGDAIGEFRNALQKNNDAYGLIHFKHPHSYYLHYFLMFGYIGLILSLLVLILPIIKSFQSKWHAAILFYLNLLIIGLTDVTTHATCACVFSLFYCMFLYNRKSDFL